MGGSVSKQITTTAAPSAKSTFEQIDEKRLIAERQSTAHSGSGFELGSSLTPDAFDKWTDDFNKDPALGLSRLVLSHADPVASLKVRSALIRDPKVFNLAVKGFGTNHEYPSPRVSQASSGRCWLFATTNVLRYNVTEKLNLGEFQLSQSYPFFYDKMEKANYYLENVLELTDEPLDSRIMSHLNASPIGDGGQWDMAVNLLEKYGMVPLTIYPESFSSSASAKMDSLITSKLREYALRLRQNPRDARKLKSIFLGEIFNTLCITLGTPPKPDEPFIWDYYDKDNKYHSWTGTPKDFYDEFGKRKNMDPKDSFSLINDPRNEYEKLYTVDRLGNVWGGRPILYINAPTDALEDAVIAGIKANTPLFFGCDVGKSSDREAGVMDSNLFDIKAAFGYSLNLTKAERIHLGETAMTHAMVITAVHLDGNGRPTRYKVENSWSEASGEKGWYMMTADWFKENVFQVVVPRSVADPRWTKVLDGGDMVHLAPWDPMGALA